MKKPKFKIGEVAIYKFKDGAMQVVIEKAQYNMWENEKHNNGWVYGGRGWSVFGEPFKEDDLIKIDDENLRNK